MSTKFTSLSVLTFLLGLSAGGVHAEVINCDDAGLPVSYNTDTGKVWKNEGQYSTEQDARLYGGKAGYYEVQLFDGQYYYNIYQVWKGQLYRVGIDKEGRTSNGYYDTNSNWKENDTLLVSSGVSPSGEGAATLSPTSASGISASASPAASASSTPRANSPSLDVGAQVYTYNLRSSNNMEFSVIAKGAGNDWTLKLKDLPNKDGTTDTLKIHIKNGKLLTDGDGGRDGVSFDGETYTVDGGKPFQHSFKCGNKKLSWHDVTAVSGNGNEVVQFIPVQIFDINNLGMSDEEKALAAAQAKQAAAQAVAQAAAQAIAQAAARAKAAAQRIPVETTPVVATPSATPVGATPSGAIPVVVKSSSRSSTVSATPVAQQTSKSNLTVSAGAAQRVFGSRRAGK